VDVDADAAADAEVEGPVVETRPGTGRWERIPYAERSRLNASLCSGNCCNQPLVDLEAKQREKRCETARVA
jgi:hypothetical protein